MGYGKSSEQKNIQNEIQAAIGNVVNFMGDNNEVTINSVKNLDYTKVHMIGDIK